MKPMHKTSRMEVASKYSTELKQKLVLFVLGKTPIWLFNQATREFSTQRMYSRYKRELMSEFKEVMPYTLDYAIVMAEAFRVYQCNEIRCKELRFKIDRLKSNIKFAKRYKERNEQMITEHNKLVDEYTVLIQPQMKLITLYKKIVKKRENK